MYRILIVEDDCGIAEAIRTQAEMWAFQVRCVQNFRNVMEEFVAFDPHLVLLDITLPFFNGYHWCSQIRQVSQVPIVSVRKQTVTIHSRSFSCEGEVWNVELGVGG